MPATMPTNPRIERVDIVERDAGELTVWPYWTTDGAPLDRPQGTGYGFRSSHRALAERLRAAMLAGAVYYDAEVRIDKFGQTYVNAPSHVLGRMANADLNRLGF